MGKMSSFGMGTSSGFVLREMLASVIVFQLLGLGKCVVSEAESAGRLYTLAKFANPCSQSLGLVVDATTSKAQFFLAGCNDSRIWCISIGKVVSFFEVAREHCLEKFGGSRRNLESCSRFLFSPPTRMTSPSLAIAMVMVCEKSMLMAAPMGFEVKL